MARYKHIDTSPRFLAVDLQRQLIPGTFEHALNHLLDHELDLSGFDARFRNEHTGAAAYLRMLLTHGARSVLRAASTARQAGRSLDGLRDWATTVQARTNHNKAACALANKLARICYATLRDGTPYGEPVRQGRKIDRTAFAIAA